jgi:hypothetical protein
VAVALLGAGLMAMASIYWDMEHYSAVERIFRQSAEFCSDNDTWKLNVAHTFFMQASTRFKWGAARCNNHLDCTSATDNGVNCFVPFWIHSDWCWAAPPLSCSPSSRWMSGAVH